MKPWVALGLVSLLGTACATEVALSEEESALHRRAPILVQEGEDQILLAVTDDNHAVYQEGQALYATALVAGAARQSVGTVPGTNVAYVLQVGKVVFVWTNPQRNAPGFGVSPLVMWTAAGGAQVISAQSSVGLVATAASADSRQIVFTTNVTADNARGDLVHAFTDDALHPTTLVANTTMGFPNAPCRPLANFGRDHGREVPVAQYCAGTDTTATMSKWVDGERTDLVANIVTPLQFIMESDARAETFLVNLANQSVATVTMDGEVTVVDAAVQSPVGFVGRHDAVGYAALVPGGAELRLARDGEAPETISTLTRVYRGSYNRAGYSKPRTVSSDGRLALFGAVRNPATGNDVNLLDLDTGEVIPLHTTPDATVFSEIFTSDGDHALAASGDDISFNTNPTLDFSSFRATFLWTGDLFVVDVDHPDATPRLVSEQASLLYLPSHDRRKLVFPSATEPSGPGLYVADARP